MFDFEISGSELKAHFAKVIDGTTAEMTERKALIEKISTTGGTAEEIAKVGPFVRSAGPSLASDYVEDQLKAKISSFEFFASKVDEKRTYSLGVLDAVIFGLLKLPFSGLPF